MKVRDGASPHSAQAARAVLETLAQSGKHASSVHEAVQLGYLTMLDWCDVLDTYRVLAGLGKRKEQE